MFQIAIANCDIQGLPDGSPDASTSPVSGALILRPRRSPPAL